MFLLIYLVTNLCGLKNPTAFGILLTCSTEHCYFRIPKPAPVSEEVKRVADKLPEIFDWRTTGFVSPVRNQGR